MDTNSENNISKEAVLYDFHGLNVKLEPKIVRVDNDAALDRLFTCADMPDDNNGPISETDSERMDECLSDVADENHVKATINKTKGKLSRKVIKKLGKKTILKEAENIRTIYEREYNTPLKITNKSLAVEIYGHYYILKKAESFEKKHGTNKLTRWLKMHMDIIDCGEQDVDNNRFVWDFLQVFW